LHDLQHVALSFFHEALSESFTLQPRLRKVVKVPILKLLLHALNELAQGAILPLVSLKVGLAALQKPIKANFEH
jgi:hypothetical protein